MNTTFVYFTVFLVGFSPVLHKLCAALQAHRSSLLPSRASRIGISEHPLTPTLGRTSGSSRRPPIRIRNWPSPCPLIWIWDRPSRCPSIWIWNRHSSRSCLLWSCSTHSLTLASIWIWKVCSMQNEFFPSLTIATTWTSPHSNQFSLQLSTTFINAWRNCQWNRLNICDGLPTLTVSWWYRFAISYCIRTEHYSQVI